MTKKIFNKFFYFSIVLVVIGISFLFVPQNILSNVFRYIVGILIILIGHYKLIMSNKTALGTREYYLDIVEGFISIFVGVISIRFYDIDIVCLVSGIVYLVVPFIRIFLSTNKINQILIDIFKFLFAGFIFMNNTLAPFATKIYLSVIFISMGIIVFIYRFLYHRKNNYDSEEELF